MATGKHIDQTRIHNSQFVCYRVERDWLEEIQDDHILQYGFSVKRPEGEEKYGEPHFNLKLPIEPELINGRDFEGGMFIVSSLKPYIIQQAIGIGLQWMVNNSRLSCDDFFDNNGHTPEG